MNWRKIAPYVCLVIVGLCQLGISLNNPHVSGLRMIDKVQLVTAGVCFGAAIMGLGTALKAARDT